MISKKKQQFSYCAYYLNFCFKRSPTLFESSFSPLGGEIKTSFQSFTQTKTGRSFLLLANCFLRASPSGERSFFVQALVIAFS